MIELLVASNRCTFSPQAFFDLFWVGRQPWSFALDVPSRGPNQHGWLLSSLPRSGVVNAQATWIQRFECSFSRAQLKWFAPSKPSSIWFPEKARNLGPAFGRSRFEDPISVVGSFQAFLKIWRLERASNLDPALSMFRFEVSVSVVGSFQAFFDLASWMGRQPWSFSFECSNLKTQSAW